MSLPTSLTYKERLDKIQQKNIELRDVAMAWKRVADERLNALQMIHGSVAKTIKAISDLGGQLDLEAFSHEVADLTLTGNNQGTHATKETLKALGAVTRFVMSLSQQNRAFSSHVESGLAELDRMMMSVPLPETESLDFSGIEFPFDISNLIGGGENESSTAAARITEM